MTTAFDRSIWDIAANIVKPESDTWKPLPHQVPPEPRDWFMWLLMGGRGMGKTATAARYIHDHVHGPPCLPNVVGGHWVSIVAPTLSDAVTSCVQGPSGLIAHDPGVRVKTVPGGLIARWSNGAEAKLFGASTPDDVERFRAGGNRCCVWLEELAAWRYMEEAYQQIRYGLRVGPRPHGIISTTPRPRALIKKLVKDPTVRMTHAPTSANPYLDATVKAHLYDDYGNTRMGRQELQGELLEDVEGALWTPETIDRTRVGNSTGLDMPPWWDRVAVGVDPAVTSGENADHTGIVVVGKINSWDDNRLFDHPDKSHGFVLDDVSLIGNPTQWARAAVRAYHEWEADCIVVEINNGGEMVKHTIQTVDAEVPVKVVHATRGKAKRAEPISNLWEEGRMHMVGMFPELEDEMTMWQPPPNTDESWSPDRMDAMVWAATHLMIGDVTIRRSQQADGRLRGRR